MNKSRFLVLFSLLLFLGLMAISLLPDDAEARRFGGGSSLGSRGSRSFSTPRQALPRQQTPTRQQSTATPPNGTKTPSPMGAGLMGGLGGLLLGGMIGSMLFGGGVGGGGGIGFLEILLIGGGIWLLFRWFKNQQRGRAPIPAGSGTTFQPYDKTQFTTDQQANDTFFKDNASSQSFNTNSHANEPTDEVSQGISHIMSMDPNFNEPQFLEGAKAAYQIIQSAWSDWSVERLRPLLTERMWGMIQNQAKERETAGRRDIVEKIQFNTAVISEAWQEGGEDWLTVHFVVSMVEYETDVNGQLIHGNPNQPIQAEEYWTFCRPVASNNPNWLLSSVQQPGEVARSVQ